MSDLDKVLNFLDEYKINLNSLMTYDDITYGELEAIRIISDMIKRLKESK